MSEKTASEAPICNYCNKRSILTDSAEVYHGRSYGPIYLCRPCQAWCGCHKGTTKPLGRLANAELRLWKQKAHAAFDPIWQKDGIYRKTAYGWLAEQLKIDRDDCHIGMFDVETCIRVVAICSARKAKDSREDNDQTIRD